MATTIINNIQEYSFKIQEYKFLPNKLFGELLDISPKTFTFVINCNSKFSCIEVWFTNQDSKPLEIEDKVNITLVINCSVKYKE